MVPWFDVAHHERVNRPLELLSVFTGRDSRGFFYAIVAEYMKRTIANPFEVLRIGGRRGMKASSKAWRIWTKGNHMNKNELHKEIDANSVGFEGQAVFLPIKDQLIRSQKSFLDTLAVIGNRHGYEDGKFTGVKLCAVATYALCDGLKKVVDPMFTLIARGMNIFMNKEYSGGVGFYKDAYGFHSILEIAHPHNGSIYVDSTYGQLDKAWVGKLLLSNGYSLGMQYQTSCDVGFPLNNAHWRHASSKRPLLANDLFDITPQKEKQLLYFDKTLGITTSGYDKLVKSVGEII